MAVGLYGRFPIHLKHRGGRRRNRCVLQRCPHSAGMCCLRPQRSVMRVASFSPSRPIDSYQRSGSLGETKKVVQGVDDKQGVLEVVDFKRLRHDPLERKRMARAAVA